MKFNNNPTKKNLLLQEKTLYLFNYHWTEVKVGRARQGQHEVGSLKKNCPTQILPFSCFDGFIIKLTQKIHLCCSFFRSIPTNACNTYLEKGLTQQVKTTHLPGNKKKSPNLESIKLCWKSSQLVNRKLPVRNPSSYG